MRSVIITFLVLLLFPGLSEAGYKVLAVQSVSVKPYDDAFYGFESECNCEIERIIINETEETDIASEIPEMMPDLILAVGKGAFLKVKNITSIPIVYLMVLNQQSLLPYGKNVTGVSMNLEPAQQLSIIRISLPEVKRLGALYDPDRMSGFVETAVKESHKYGLEFIPEEVHTHREVPDRLKSLAGRIDCYWMLPDATVLTPETEELFTEFSIEFNVPVVTFSDKYLEKGALLSMGVDPYDMGRQAAEIAGKIFSGVRIEEVKPVEARRIVLSINDKVERSLALRVNREKSGNILIHE
ncbi:MAG: ABC transporter substrate binding protein [Spirochaetota bacterium]